MPTIVARYHEIALKRGNRARFAAALATNVRRACAGLAVVGVEDVHGRLVAELTDESDWPEARLRIERVFGIANFSLASSLARSEVERGGGVDVAPLAEAVAEAASTLRFASFRIHTRRADKRFPLPSPEVNAAVGAVVKQRSGARVDLDHAELTATIEILLDRILYSVEKIPGAGGLPVGSSGHVLALLSGGIDSPVAAVRMMRRGCRVSLVHFTGAPYLDRSSTDKARELARRLAAWGLGTQLVVVPFGEVQRAIVLRVPPAPRVLLYRRMMLRIASEIARVLGAEALVTGDMLGQVASQTLANLAVVEEAAELPLFRPLVAMDKLEVTNEAVRVGTFDVSIEPDQDCCSLFLPRHPSTRSTPQAIAAAESPLDLAALAASAVAGASVERYRFPPAERDGAPLPLSSIGGAGE
ncbi:MAG: tRNA uracil 4-sulfurtransferase [Candidatus Binatota bacterium]|nr:tRNA uracil 4-sulfurtransferase [Candidatus Binatota bacterium]